MGVARGLLAALAVLLAAAALAGCSVRRAEDADYDEWTHPTKDVLEIRADRADCQRFHGGSDRDIEDCLKAKGWKRKERKGFSLF